VRLPTPRQRAFFEQAVTTYAQDLASDTSAQGYLRSRGIGPEAASSFRLGVVRRPLVGHEQYSGRLCIPYLTPAGVVNFTFRCITLNCGGCDDPEQGHPKYLAALPERSLYNVKDLGTESQSINVTEGELDALILSINGYPAVGTPGVDSWKPWFTLCLADFAEVFVWGDGDKAGRKFNRFMEREINARPVAVPKQEDANGIYLRGGRAALAACLPTD
jgi:DNA primase